LSVLIIKELRFPQKKPKMKKQAKHSIRGIEKPKNNTGMLSNFTNGFFCEREK
jgi:hypothetical protein